MRAFLELHRMPIRDPLADLPIDEEEFLQKRERKVYYEPIEIPLDVPTIRKGTGFRPFPGLRPPLPVRASYFSLEATLYFKSQISPPLFGKYQSFTETMMWKIQRLGKIPLKRLQYAFSKITSEVRRIKAFMAERET